MKKAGAVVKEKKRGETEVYDAKTVRDAEVLDAEMQKAGEAMRK